MNIICKICLVEKEETAFWYKSKKLGKRYVTCIACEKSKESYKVKIKNKPSHCELKTIVCKTCKEDKNLTDFSPNCYRCRKCSAMVLKERRKLLIRPPTTEPQRCRECKDIKESIDFKVSKESKNGIRRVCKMCLRSRSKVYRIDSSKILS
jgi:hypothetical protein